MEATNTGTVSDATANRALLLADRSKLASNWQALYDVGATTGELELLGYLASRADHEQATYWSRFAAFAGLNAGAFVLITSDVIEDKVPFAIGGTLLAFSWLVIQWLSLRYVDRDKEPFHMYRRCLGLEYPHERDPRWTAQGLRRWLRPSSTLLGLVAAAIVLALWLWALAHMRSDVG